MKNLYTGLLSGLLFCSISVLAQVYPPSQQLVYHQMSSIPKPGYLSPVTDPIFGTTVIRITDRAVFDTYNTNSRTWHKYAKNQPWNSNGTLIHMDGWPGAILDAQTYQVVNMITPPGGPNTWSNTQPNIMYGTNHGGFGDNCIVRLDISTGTYSAVSCFSEYESISYGYWEGNMSNDDRYMALQCIKPGGAMEIACYDFVTNAIISTMPAPVWPNNVAMSQSGQYVIVQWDVEGTDAAQGTWAYNSSNMSSVRNLTARGGSHFDYGYDTDGNEVIVGHVSYNRELQMRRIDNGVITSLLSESQMGYPIHVSCRNLNRPGYAYVSEFAESYAVTTNPYYQKVFAVKLDPTANANALTETFAQPHHSTNVAYDRATFGVPNRNGSTVMFRSDWEGNASSEINSYVAFMPGGPGCNLSCTAVETTAPSCDDSNGVATATPQSGTAPYTYQWSSGQTTATANNLPGGTYTVTITDANNCSTSCTVTLVNSNNGNAGAFANVLTQNSVAWNAGTPYVNRAQPTLGVWEPGDISGTEIMRVSDASGNGLHFYNSRQVWNIDMTKLMIGDGVIEDNKLLDATNNYALLPTRVPLNSQRVWSNTNPNLIYGIRANTQFCVFNVATDVTTVLYTRPGNTTLSLRSKGNLPGDDSKIALYEPSTNRIISFDLQTNSVIAEIVWPHGNINDGGNYVSFDWTGNWIVAGMGTGSDKLYRMNPDLTGISEVHNNVEHWDMAYDVNGESVQVQTRGNGSVQIVNIDDPNKNYISPVFGGADPAVGVMRFTPDYISGRGQTSAPGWVAFGGEAQAGSPNHPLGLYKIDGNTNTPTIKVVGFDHHSTAQAASVGGNDDRQKPSVSPDGNQVIFTSDWGVPNGALSAYIIRGTGGGSSCTLTCTATQTTAPTCAGNNGQASVSASDGTPPYTYAWSNGQTAQTIGGLAAGTYTVLVTDANNETSSCTVTLTDPSNLSCSIVETSPPTNGNNGIATVAATGGTTSSGDPRTALLDSPDRIGYGAAAIGGSNYVYVTNFTQLKNALETAGNYVLLDPSIAGQGIGFTGGITPASNTTLDGSLAPGSWLFPDYGAGYSDNTAMISYFSTNNNIVYSIEIRGNRAVPYSSNHPSANVTAFNVRGATIWFDHITITEFWGHGIMAAQGGDYISISNMKFFNTGNAVWLYYPNSTPRHISLFNSEINAAQTAPNNKGASHFHMWNNYIYDVLYGASTTGYADNSAPGQNGLVRTFSENNVFTNTSPEAEWGLMTGENFGGPVRIPGYIYSMGNIYNNGTATKGNVINSTAPWTIPYPYTLMPAAQVQTYVAANAGKIPVTGGGGYNYQWNDAAGQTTDVASGLSSGTYQVTVTDAAGCTSVCSVTMTGAPVTINIGLWLEGSYNPNTTLMTNGLEQLGLLPTGQPYDTAPWNYAGTENLDISNVADWLLVSFRTSTAKEDEVARTAGLLQTDGSIYFPDDNVLSGNFNTPLYIVIEHRNHMGIMSPQPIPISNNILSYDFRTADSYSIGGGLGQKQVSTGIWAMPAGDIDPTDAGSYDINGADKAVWQSQNGLFNVYLPADLNQDGDVNGGDKALWVINNGSFSSVPK